MPITFELALENERIKERQTHLGFRALEGEIYPLLLQSDGTVDYGSFCKDPADRFVRTNIMQKTIRIGELFTMEEVGDNGVLAEFTYRIQRVEKL